MSSQLNQSAPRYMIETALNEERGGQWAKKRRKDGTSICTDWRTATRN